MIINESGDGVKRPIQAQEGRGQCDDAYESREREFEVRDHGDLKSDGMAWHGNG